MNPIFEDVFSLPEGPVILRWPASLSAESLEDLMDWLKLIDRKINRSGLQTIKTK